MADYERMRTLQELSILLPLETADTIIASALRAQFRRDMGFIMDRSDRLWDATLRKRLRDLFLSALARLRDSKRIEELPKTQGKSYDHTPIRITEKGRESLASFFDGRSKRNRE